MIRSPSGTEQTSNVLIPGAGNASCASRCSFSCFKFALTSAKYGDWYINNTTGVQHYRCPTTADDVDEAIVSVAKGGRSGRTTRLPGAKMLLLRRLFVR